MNSLYNFMKEKYVLVVIECAAFNKSRSLKLDHLNIVELPVTIAECQELVKLYLQHNSLNTLPEEFKLLAHLEYLALDFNNICTVPTTLWDLHNLVELNLGHNPIKKLPPEIKLLKKLESLWLNSCELSELPDEICDLESLYTFGARNNFIKTLPANFHKLNIKWLTLAYNRLEFLPDNFKLQNLIHLNLSYNHFTTLPYQLSHLKKLRYCFLRANKITHLNNTSILAEMNHILKIDLQENPILYCDHVKEYKNVFITHIIIENYSDYDSDSSGDWEESLNSSDIDSSNSESENEENPEFRVPPYTSKFLLS